MTLSEGLVIAVVFVLAGGVKGVVGLGLPTISLGLLTAVIGLPAAIALMLAPSFLTNVWQALVGGPVEPVLRRLWPFFVTATAFVWAGVLLAGRLPVAVLSAVLGASLIAYATFGLLRPGFALADAAERWVGPSAGAVNGVIAGLTGSSVMPGVAYFQAIGLPRQQLVQAMGFLFALSTGMLAVALAATGRLTWMLGLGSLLAVVPALVGMELGRRLRHRLSETLFRRCLFVALGGLGVHLMLAALR